jgi:hypothetical protein
MLEVVVDPKLLKPLTISEKNALDEPKLIVGECAPNIGATICDRFVKLARCVGSGENNSTRGGSHLCRL